MGEAPRILAFASDDVIRHYRAFYKVCFELATWLESLGIPSDDAKMVKLRDQAIADKVKLQKEMRDDLRK